MYEFSDYQGREDPSSPSTLTGPVHNVLMTAGKPFEEAVDSDFDEFFDDMENVINWPIYFFSRAESDPDLIVIISCFCKEGDDENRLFAIGTQDQRFEDVLDEVMSIDAFDDNELPIDNSHLSEFELDLYRKIADLLIYAEMKIEEGSLETSSVVLWSEIQK